MSFKCLSAVYQSTPTDILIKILIASCSLKLSEFLIRYWLVFFHEWEKQKHVISTSKHSVCTRIILLIC